MIDTMFIVNSPKEISERQEEETNGSTDTNNSILDFTDLDTNYLKEDCLAEDDHSVEIERSEHHTITGQTETERSSDQASCGSPERLKVAPEAQRKSQRVLLAEWLRERDYPNRALDFLPKKQGSLIWVSNHNN